MTNMDLEKTGQDLKNKDTRKHAVGTIAGGIIGGVIGGYPGMMIGMSIGGYLFKPSSPNKKDYNNPDYKISNARIDSVPDIIGTDICPGKVIYFNKDNFGVYDSGHLPGTPVGRQSEWLGFIDALAAQKVAYWAEFAVNFAGNYKTATDSHVGVMKFNGKPFWFWTIFSDQWENYVDSLNPAPPLTVIDAAKIEYDQNINIEELISQDINFNNIMYFKGFFADFTGSAVSPDTSNIYIDLRLMEDIKPEQLPGTPKAMPIFTAEVNTDRVWLSPESMHGGSGMPGSGSYYNNPGGDYDPDTYYNYSVNMNRYWSCRDAKNNNYVGVAGGYNYQTESYQYYPVFLEGSERQWDYAIAPYDRHDYYHDPNIVKDYFRDNIISPSYSPDKDPTKLSTARHYNSAIGFLQCTDVIDNRVYVCTYRNWMNAQTTEHHHVGYGVKFDIYYHDRSSPYQEVHSLLYDYQMDNQEGGEGCNPSIHFGSMQVDADYIYIFGSRTQTDMVLTDRRTIDEGENSYVKIYADFSQYDDGFWEGYYAALSVNQYKLWRTIIEQTSTYIVVDREFAGFPTVNTIVKVSKYPQWVSEFGTIGAINDDGHIIVDVPEFNPEGWIHPEWEWNDDEPPELVCTACCNWQKVFLVGKWLFGAEIGKIEGTELTLFVPFQYYEPKVGDRLCFTMGSSTCFWDHHVDPDMYNEYGQHFTASIGLGGLGFDIDRSYSESKGGPEDQLNAARIQGNEWGRSHHVAWRIDKITGVVERFPTATTENLGDPISGDERVTTPTYYAGPNLTFTGGVNVYSCATDKTAFVYSHESQYGTQMAVYSYVLDFDGSEIIEPLHRRNNFAGGHAPAWCYMGCVPVKEWDEGAKEYVNVWYTVLRCFDSSVSPTGFSADTIGGGTHFLRLNDGRFSNQGALSDAIHLYYGLDLGDNIDIILYRKGIATGPTVMAMYIGSMPDENNYQIGKFGINEDIYFTNVKYPGLMGTGMGSMYEMWRYTPPTEVNTAGELYCIGKSALWDADNNNLSFQWSKIPYMGYFVQCRYGFYGVHESGRWYQCDESPPRVIEDLFMRHKEPSYISESDVCDFNEATEICNEIIDTTLYTIKENIDLKERRFQFSQCYDQPKKFHDVLNEVMDTCQGFLSVCLWEFSYGSPRYKMIVPNSTETPSYYFGYDSAVLVSTQESIIYEEGDIIYGDFSAYPDNYWKGDFVYYIEEKDHGPPGIVDPDFPPRYRNWGVVIEQTSTYIKIGDAIYGFPEGEQFTLKKDNIKEGSFTFAEKSEMDRPNKVRIEFKNRLLGYIKDVAEAEDAYRLDVLGEPEKIDFYKMHGIKRATQAGRMAMRILDQWNHQRYVCAFETDIMGIALCMGEIIGVGHPITGWNSKWFRIVAMEELMDFEVKLELEEFNPYCYHDNGVPVMHGYSHSGFPTPYVPRNVERLEVKEDIEFNRLYFTFKKPARDAGFFIGGRVYRKTGDTWDFVATINETVSSVKLAQSVGIDDTTIYYDNDSLYGSFPSQGVIWIENELMYYHGIDTVNYAFTNVVRGYKDTDQVEHSLDNSTLYITLKDDSISYLEIDQSWAGTTQTFKVSATTLHFLTISIDISPTISIDIIGHGVLPYFPESIQNKIPGTENIFESLGLEEYTIEKQIEHIAEILGLGDSKIVTETLKRLTESIGLGDLKIDTSDRIEELIESLGLGDHKYSPDYVNVFETLGLSDTSTIAEMLLAISEILGLGDALEAIEESEDAVMMILNNNML